MATAVYCSGLWEGDELGAGGRGVGSKGHAEITLAIDDSICVFKL